MLPWPINAGNDVFYFYHKHDGKKILEYIRVPAEHPTGYYCIACLEAHGTHQLKNSASVCCETNDISLPAPVFN